MTLIALTKGRIENNFYKLLNINSDFGTRKLYLDINNYRLLIVKSIDVLELVDKKIVDIGIVGSDTINEYKKDNIEELLDLKTGICNFSLATLPNTSIENINVVATKYPNTTKRLLNSMGINPNIVVMNGSLELAPIINYADAIVDLVETGNTLKENGLVNMKQLENVSTRIITNKDNKNNDNVKKLIKRLER